MTMAYDQARSYPHIDDSEAWNNEDDDLNGTHDGPDDEDMSFSAQRKA